MSVYSPIDTVPTGYTQATAVATKRGWVDRVTGALIAGNEAIVPFLGLLQKILQLTLLLSQQHLAFSLLVKY